MTIIFYLYFFFLLGCEFDIELSYWATENLLYFSLSPKVFFSFFSISKVVDGNPSRRVETPFAQTKK